MPTNTKDLIELVGFALAIIGLGFLGFYFGDIVLAAAVLLIGAGVVLIMIGNQK